MTEAYSLLSRPLNRFLSPTGPIFTVPDVALIERLGLSAWAVQQELVWEDSLLDWPVVPSVLRSVLLAEALEPLQLPIRYALPFRHLGRVLTFALLPAGSGRPVRVRRAEETAAPNQKARDLLLRDPPVPFLTLGLAGPETVARHARCVRQFLLAGSSREIRSQLPTILVELARRGEATKSEACYYLVGMRALASGTWRQLRENFDLMSLEYLVEQATGPNPVQAQLLAEALLVEGRAIAWPAGEDPFDVELRRDRASD